MYRFLTLVIAAFCLASCTALSMDNATVNVTVDDSTTTSQPPSTLTSSPVAITTIAPTSIHTPTFTSIPTTVSTYTCSPISTPADCVPGVISYVGRVDGLEDVIFLACADGSYSQQVVSESSVLPEGWNIHDLEASIDGQRIAFSANNTNSPLNDEDNETAIYLLNLYDCSVIEVYTGNGTLQDINWSPDGEYIVYTRSESSEEGFYTHVEALHVDSRTISRLVDGLMELRAVENGVGYHACRPTWSSANDRILYSVWQEYYASPPEIVGYITSVICDQQNHRCQVRDENRLDWTRYRDQLFWADNDSQIVGVFIYGLENTTLIERCDIGGVLCDSVTLNGESLGIAQSTLFEISPDERYLAINPSGEAFYLLDLDTEELTDLSDTCLANTRQFDWVP